MAPENARFGDPIGDYWPLIPHCAMSPLPDRSSHDDTKPAREASPESPGRAAFEEVLRQTLAGSDHTEETAEIELLVAVARRHPGESLQTDPIVRELVGTVLRARFAKLRAPADFWDHVAGDIARTLMEDPQQNAILHRFWSRLSDKAA